MALWDAQQGLRDAVSGTSSASCIDCPTGHLSNTLCCWHQWTFIIRPVAFIFAPAQVVPFMKDIYIAALSASLYAFLQLPRHSPRLPVHSPRLPLRHVSRDDHELADSMCEKQMVKAFLNAINCVQRIQL